MWIFWILLVVLVVWVLKAATGAGTNNSHEKEGPLDILKKRYASGEIDESEYQRRRKELER